VNRLHERIVRLIEANGPLPLAEYMHLCLADPAQGYYARIPEIGARGDFVTAPEVSQMFGELIGVWCVAMWRAVGSPRRFVLAEAGPGNGTLLADLLRAARRFEGFAEAADVCLIETGMALAARQRALLAPLHPRLTWARDLSALPQGPLVFIANEFLDALPVRQYVKSAGLWRERCVGLESGGALCWRLGPRLAPVLPAGNEVEPDGAVFEHAPARESFVATLAGRLAGDGGAALLIDYGHAESGFGDTFQAVRNHRFADPLDAPGAADLTSHVDFAAIARAAMARAIAVSPVTSQGEFLSAMGMEKRARALARADPAAEPHIRAAATRLVSPDAMGALFKVLALYGTPPAPSAPPFAG
jgi:SAM-dependent MidA family methyltransferase